MSSILVTAAASVCHVSYIYIYLQFVDFIVIEMGLQGLYLFQEAVEAWHHSTKKTNQHTFIDPLHE